MTPRHAEPALQDIPQGWVTTRIISHGHRLRPCPNGSQLPPGSTPGGRGPRSSRVATACGADRRSARSKLGWPPAPCATGQRSSASSGGAASSVRARPPVISGRGGTLHYQKPRSQTPCGAATLRHNPRKCKGCARQRRATHTYMSEATFVPSCGVGTGPRQASAAAKRRRMQLPCIR